MSRLFFVFFSGRLREILLNLFSNLMLSFAEHESLKLTFPSFSVDVNLIDVAGFRLVMQWVSKSFIFDLLSFDHKVCVCNKKYSIVAVLSSLLSHVSENFFQNSIVLSRATSSSLFCFAEPATYTNHHQSALMKSLWHHRWGDFHWLKKGWTCCRCVGQQMNSFSCQ